MCSPGLGSPPSRAGSTFWWIDEAHNVAPSGRGAIQLDSMRTEAIRTLAPHFEHKLFLSATPHNGYRDSFTALLELLDNQRFARSVPPREDQLRTSVVRRLKSEIVDRWGQPRFARREVVPLEVDYQASDERRVHSLLRRYTESRQQQAQTPAERVATEFVLKLLKKRLFSSPAAFASTLEKHRESLRSATANKSGRLSKTQLEREFDRLDEEFGDDEQYTQAADETLETASRLSSVRPATKSSRCWKRWRSGRGRPLTGTMQRRKPALAISQRAASS